MLKWVFMVYFLSRPPIEKVAYPFDTKEACVQSSAVKREELGSIGTQYIIVECEKVTYIAYEGR